MVELLIYHPPRLYFKVLMVTNGPSGCYLISSDLLLLSVIEYYHVYQLLVYHLHQGQGASSNLPQILKALIWPTKQQLKNVQPILAYNNMYFLLRRD